jgi:hypothetical protein
MGLDQFAYVRRPEGENDEEIAYWRKHNRLEGYFSKLYHDRGGTDQFNLEKVELSLEDLDKLEKVIENEDLPETQGFFFGGDSYSDYRDPEWGYYEKDQAFIREARERIEAGETVYYTSWW